MNKKAKIKTKQELAECSGSVSEWGSYQMPDRYDGRGGDSFTDEMLYFSGKTITIKNWDGWIGQYKEFNITLPMIKEEHNRNKANEC